MSEPGPGERPAFFRRLSEAGEIELLRSELGGRALATDVEGTNGPGDADRSGDAGGGGGDDDGELHYRSFDEYVVEVVEQGMCRCGYGRQSTLLMPGAVLVVEPGVPLARTRVGPGEVRVRTLLVPTRVMSGGRGPARMESKLVVDAALAGRLLELHTRLLSPSASGGLSVAAGDQLLALLGELVARHGTPMVSAVPPAVEPRRIRVIREHLASHLTAPASLDQLSDLVGVSPFYLQRTFKAVTLMSPREYLMDLRIRRARQLLREGQTPRVVGTSVGFFDQSHFTRAFRRLTGVTPGAYARRG